ncbi:DsbA family protein, partial [Microbacterium sp.]|uniref:DsbA family protein n=1 Tax=Microbacterium sp. TaxID=51671 RepID=UPI003A8A946C
LDGMGESTAPARPTALRRRLLVVAAVVVVFIALVIVAQLIPQSPTVSAPASTANPTATTEAQPATELPIVRRQEGDPAAVGAVDAPVVLVMWTDMRCPFCAVFSRETLPALTQEYIDSGQVRLEVHTVAFFGEQSADAAVAALAAGDQGRYFEFLHTVYDAAPDDARAELPRDVLIAFAEQAGVPDIARFTAALDEPALMQSVQATTATAQQIGVGSVPFFVVGETALAGAQPVDVFRSFLDSALPGAG